MKTRTRSSLAVIVLATAAFVVTPPGLVTPAFAQAIRACVVPATNELRLIAASENCLPTERVTILTVYPGPAGPQGQAGPQGTKGEKGTSGVEGPQGPVGATGPAGPQGVTGDQGTTGMPGPVGTLGIAGPQGPQGDKGATGLQGPAGSQGLTGTEGPQGNTGNVAAGQTCPIGQALVGLNGDGTIQCAPFRNVLFNAMRVFVSSRSYPGTWGGVASDNVEAVDGECQAMAGAAGFRGTFKAWFSTATSNVWDRFSHPSVPYVRLDGAVVADNFAALVWPQSLKASISMDESGNTVDDDVWTNSWYSGNRTGDSCAQASPNGLLGGVGLSTSTNYQVGAGGDSTSWSYSGRRSCGMSYARLYCFQQ